MAAEARIPESVLPRIYRGQDVLELPEPDWLLEDFIQKGGLTIVYGEPGGGKYKVKFRESGAWRSIRIRGPGLVMHFLQEMPCRDRA